MQGFSDHGVSEALYLADPDGNGIEVYRDRPRSEWRFVNGRLQMAVDPLDVEALLQEAGDGAWSGLDAATRMGHVHLKVSRIAESEAFYAGVLGFDVMARYGAGALFLSAGGYHHHLGLNTWSGVGIPAPPPDATGLIAFTVLLPSERARHDVLERISAAGFELDRLGPAPAVRDPSGNVLSLEVDG
jgi:catechol 2,3-dioxygenase